MGPKNAAEGPARVVKMPKSYPPRPHGADYRVDICGQGVGIICEPAWSAKVTANNINRALAPIVERANMADTLASKLKTTLSVYLKLAESGDAGYWNPHEEGHVVDAKAVLAEYAAIGGKSE